MWVKNSEKRWREREFVAVSLPSVVNSVYYPVVKNPFFQTKSLTAESSVRWAGIFIAAALLAGCDRNEIKVYQVAKDSAPPASAMPTAMPSDMTAAMQPSLTWKTPEGWTEEKPGQMRLASFKASKDGKSVDISIVPLPGAAGGDTPNVNRWRGQVGLEGVTPDEISKAAEAVEAGGQPASLYDIAGKNPAGEAARIIAVIQHRDDMAWFSKMTGDDQLVAAQKPAFVEFLKSLNFTAGPATAAAALPAELPAGHPPMDGAAMGAAALPTASSGEGKPSWSVPAGWTEIPGGQFLVAKFTIAGEGDAKAAVNVSMSAGTGGGLAGNVNRWRGQLSLTPLGEAELSKETKPLEIAVGPASLVDMSGTDTRTQQPTRLVGVIVPQTGQTWFYKLMGDAKVVENQKDAFMKFVQGVKY